MLTIALTGATGFIGSALLKHFNEQGYRVKALFRPSSSTSSKNNNQIEWLPGDLENLDSLRALLAGVDVVVHCAGVVRGTTLESFSNVNADGVEHILQVAVEQKVPRFLLISSLAARAPFLSAYAASKKLGEDILLQYQDKITWNILRPPAVYGPGDREMQPLLKLIKRGIIPAIGSKDGRFSLLHVDDLVKAVDSLLQADSEQNGRCFELHDGHADGYSWQQIAKIATQLNGKSPRFISIPRAVLQVAGLTNFYLAKLAGYRPMLTPGKVRELFYPDWVCDNTLLTNTTGWEPQVLFKDGMKQLMY